MSELDLESSPSSLQETLPWWKVWIEIFTHPSVERYQILIDDSRAGIKRGLVWLVFSNLAGYLILFIPAVLVWGLFAMTLVFDSETSLMGMGLLLIPLAGLPVMVVWGTTAGLIFSGVCHLIARLLGGNGSYAKLFYLYASYMAPYMIVYSMVTLVPFLSLLMVPVAWYTLYIQITAVKTVYRLSWEKSAGVVAVPVLANLLIMGAIFLLIFIMWITGFLVGFPEFFPDIIQNISALAL